MWALIGPLSRVPLGHGLGPAEVAVWRCLFGALLFGLHGLRRKALRVSFKEGAAFALFGMAGIGMLFYCYFTAVLNGGAAMAAVLLYTAPAWVAVFSRLFFKEPLGFIKLSGLALAMLGSALVCFSGGGLPQKTDFYGIAAGLLAGFFYALHYPFGKKYLQRHSVVTLYAYAMPFGALVLLPFADFSPKAASDWLALLGLAVLSTYFGYWLYGQGLKRLPATRAAVLCNLEPLLAALLAFVFWDELFPPSGWLGSALILGAVFLMILDGNREHAAVLRRK